MKAYVMRTAMTGAAVAALAAAGCGGNNNNSGGSSESAASTPAATTPASGSTTAAPATDTSGLYKGTEEAPPTDGPTPKKSANVWFVSCGMSIPDCATPARSAQEAAKTLGWNFKIADGALNVGGGNVRAMQDALAASPDAIIVHGIDCPVIKAPLQEAKRKGIPVLGLENTDCSDPTAGGGPSLFTAEMKYSTAAPTAKDYFQSWGKLSAQYIAAKDPNAKIIDQHGTNPLHETVDAGFKAGIKSCTGCQIVDEVGFNSSDQIPNGPLAQRFKTALIKNPTATAVYMPFDVNIAGAGGAKDVKEAGLKAMIAGGSGGAAVMDLIRQGDVTMCSAHDIRWMGYGAMDNLNRVLNGQPTVTQGIGVRAVDKDNNLPSASGEDYQSPIDWKASYKKTWSGGGTS